MESIIKNVVGEREPELKITEVYYEELKSKNFENCRVGLRATIGKYESYGVVLAAVKEEVRKELMKWHNGDIRASYDKEIEEKKREIVELESRLSQIRKKIMKSQSVLSLMED